MSVKVATREAASPELFSDSPQLVNDYLARQGINPSPFKCELRAIHLHVALHAVYGWRSAAPGSRSDTAAQNLLRRLRRLVRRGGTC